MKKENVFIVIVLVREFMLFDISYHKYKRQTENCNTIVQDYNIYL